jgi:hypothetical protein
MMAKTARDSITWEKCGCRCGGNLKTLYDTPMKSPELTQKPSGQLEYTGEFKELIHENPDAIPTFLILEKKALKELSENGKYLERFEEDGVALTLNDSLGKRMKVEFGGQAFFVKSRPGYYRDPEGSSGAAEFSSAEAAREMLEEIEGVEVVNSQLGYQNSDGTTYFVSKWIEGVRLQDQLEKLMILGYSENTDEAAAAEELRTDLRKRMTIIQDLLKKYFHDVEIYNMMYDPKTKNIVVFDIHRKTK